MRLYFEVGMWHLWAQENDAGAIELWLRPEDGRHEIYIGKWPREEQ